MPKQLSSANLDKVGITRFCILGKILTWKMGTFVDIVGEPKPLVWKRTHMGKLPIFGRFVHYVPANLSL